MFREQRRAVTATRLIGQIGESQEKGYNTLVHKLPVLVRTSGLLQSVAFVQSKRKTEKDAHSLILSHLHLHLQEAGLASDGEDLRSLIAKADQTTYRRLEEEALACLRWQKMVAAAKFGEPAENERSS